MNWNLRRLITCRIQKTSEYFAFWDRCLQQHQKSAHPCDAGRLEKDVPRASLFLWLEKVCFYAVLLLVASFATFLMLRFSSGELWYEAGPLLWILCLALLALRCSRRGPRHREPYPAPRASSEASELGNALVRSRMRTSTLQDPSIDGADGVLAGQVFMGGVLQGDPDRWRDAESSEEIIPPIQAVFRFGIQSTGTSSIDVLMSRLLNQVREVYASHPKTAEIVVQHEATTATSNAVIVVHWWRAHDLLDYLFQFQRLTLMLRRRCRSESLGCEISHIGLSVRYTADSDCGDLDPNLFSQN